MVHFCNIPRNGNTGISGADFYYGDDHPPAICGKDFEDTEANRDHSWIYLDVDPADWIKRKRMCEFCVLNLLGQKAEKHFGVE